MSPAVTPGDVLPDVLPEAGPVVAVLVPLNLPGLTEPVAELMCELTRTALHALAAAGARPLLVDLSAAERPAIEQVTSADGVLLLGGGDMDPALYGHEEPVDNAYGVDRDVDDFSLGVVRASLASEVPVLGICRGSQVLNVALGGTLIPDIEDFALHHGESDDELFIDEDVTVDPNSWVGRTLGRERVTVRSGHHQAIDQVGEGLRVVARADDGLAEAVEHEQQWAVGVQWHPEEAQASADDLRRLFAAFTRRVYDS